jgi:predicted Fe-Mo cluster-binding NifX family protein
MNIAIPVTNGRLSSHFGHCEEFAVFEANEKEGSIVSKSLHQPPPHEPGVLPRWLSGLGADVVLAGGMGQRALQQFAQHGIDVVIGVPTETAENLALAYLRGTLQGGANLCDH